MSYFSMLCVVLLFYGSVSSRYTSPFSDLDEHDENLLKAAFESRTFDDDDDNDEMELQPGKLDLKKDTLWLIKTKLKELKAFDKALFANLMSTKLKLKELLKDKFGLKKHDGEVDRKPSYNYHQAPHYHQPTYEPTQYAPLPEYGHDPYYGH